MVNVNMLKAKIIEKNIEKKKIAECLGISSPSPPPKNNPKLLSSVTVSDFFYKVKAGRSEQVYKKRNCLY